jgi:excinuclease UvrABC ATPase subunit
MAKAKQAATTAVPPSTNATDTIHVRGARVNNLQNISLDLPKKKITVFTGVSGSGKSSLVFDTLAAESQRLLNETLPTFVQTFLPRQPQPDVDALENLSAAIIVDQSRIGGNSRSTVGTVSDTAALLRLLFSRLGKPSVPRPSALSFNDPLGLCKTCDGIGVISSIDVKGLIDESKSLEEGALLFPGFAVDSWFYNIISGSGFFDPKKKLAKYSADERHKLLHEPECKVKIKVGNKMMGSTYEGLIPKLRRLYLAKNLDDLQANIRSALEPILTREPCADCGGTRLNAAALACRVDDGAGHAINIAEATALPVSELLDVVTRKKSGFDNAATAPVQQALARRLQSLVDIGLGYLALDRESSTLSGGESQRVKMVRALGSSLTDLTYIFDEPSIGLHPADLHRLNTLLVQLRDKGNTVLVVEHKPAVIAIADHIVDIGPGAGEHGGRVVYEGDVEGLKNSSSVTGQALSQKPVTKTRTRTPTGWIELHDVTLHNLKNLSVRIPQGVFVVVTGVAGSGKSSLIRQTLPQRVKDVVVIDQSLARGSSRSNLATWTGILDAVRKLFATTNKVSESLFSANSKGACPECQGLGVVYTDIAHLDPVAVPCEACGGRRFTDAVLKHKVRGRSIGDVFDLSVEDAAAFFVEPAIHGPLQSLDDVGLGYVRLGQPLNTLSGGERQRMKLARSLHEPASLAILDEPTTGLHLKDIDRLVAMVDRLVDAGTSVVVIEHHPRVIRRADWIIDMGPGAGHEGGRVVFEGTPTGLLKHPTSLTGKWLSREG